jgi:hypothetical protein
MSDTFKALREFWARLAIPPELLEFAQPLGELTIAWNLLEAEINLMLISVTDNYNTDTADLVFPELDFREKIKAIRNCAYMEHPTDRWFDLLENELNDVDNEHRPNRNRFVHDHLVIEEGAVWRITKQLKLVRPQAFQRSLHYRTRSNLSKHQIQRVTRQIRASTVRLRALRGEFERLRPRTQRASPQNFPPKPGEQCP